MKQMHENISFINDSFRQSALQGEFKWPIIREAAVVAVDRLNRLCKGKTARSKNISRNVDGGYIDFFARCSTAEVSSILNLPRFAHCMYIQAAQSDVSKLDMIYYAQCLQQSIRTYTLPANICRQQYDVFAQNVRRRGPLALQSNFIHVCLLCCAKKTNTTSNYIRFNVGDVVKCDFCRQTKYILKINTLGRVVRVYNSFYYFCNFCCKVHPWRHDGSEFHECCLKSCVPRRPTPCCIICKKIQCEVIPVLDDRIGVIQNVTLCRSHMPYENMIPLIYNLDSLWIEINRKTFKRHKNRENYLN